MQFMRYSVHFVASTVGDSIIRLKNVKFQNLFVENVAVIICLHRVNLKLKNASTVQKRMLI